MSKPYAVPVQPENIPAEIGSLDRWVVWRWWWNGMKWTKPPLHHQTLRFHDPLDWSNWTSFSRALDTYRRQRLDGVGFVLGDGYCGVDLDDCIEGDGIAPKAEAIVDYIRSYAEKSPSGTGVKIIGRADGSWGNKKDGIEVYGCDRYFAMTGHAIRPYEIASCGDKVQRLYDFVFGAVPSVNKQLGHRGKREAAVALATLPRSNHVRRLVDLEPHELTYLQKFIKASDRALVGTRSDFDFGLVCQAVRYRLDPAEVYNLVRHLPRYQSERLFIRDWSNAIKRTTYL